MKTISIGRSASNVYPVEDSTVSKQHAVITVTDAGEVWIKDLNSTNGTFVDGRRITDNTKLLPGNVVRLGNKTVNWQEISSFQPRRKMETVQPYSANRRVIGRGDDCQIRMNYPDVSTHHATLEKCPDGSVMIVDTNSTNGTFVNGMRITGSVQLKAGDSVMLANKYPLDWQSIFPATAAPTPVVPITNGKKGLMIAAVAAVAVIAIGVVIFLRWPSIKGLLNIGEKEVVEEKPLQPAEIYAKYKKSVALIYMEYTYVTTYKGKPLTSYWNSQYTQMLCQLCVKNGEPAAGIMGCSGSGSFISNDGKILTNRHVVSYTGKEDETAGDIRAVVKQFIYQLATHLGGNEGRNWLAIANDIERVDVEMKIVRLGVFLNDTYVKSIDDMIPCTVVKLSDDEKLDAAIIQTNSKTTPDGVTVVDVNDCSKAENIEVGDPIYTIGFPNSFDYAQTDVGIEANNQDGTITQLEGEYTYGHNIQTTGGASGSPIFDAYGKFAGLHVSGKLDENGNRTGYKSAVHPFKLRDFVNK